VAEADPYGLMLSGLPPDLQAEAGGLSRKQQLAKLLMAQSMQGIPLPGQGQRMVGRTSPLEGVAKVVQAYMAQKGLDEADKGYTDLETRALKGKSEAMGRYEAMKLGSPAQELPPLAPNDDEGNAMPVASKAAVPGDTRKALAMAMMDPYLNKNPLVTADVKAYEKSQEPYSLRPGEGRYQGTEQVTRNAPAPIIKEGEDKKYWKINPDTGKVEMLGGPGQQNNPNEPFNRATGLANLPAQAFKSAQAASGASRQTTNVQNWTPANEKVQEEGMKKLIGNYDNLRSVPVMLENIQQAKQLIPEAASFMGPGGDFLLEGAKFLNNRAGMNINTEGIKSAEELRSRIFTNIMENLKKLDAQPTERQQLALERALGSLKTDPNALSSVLDAYGDVLSNKVKIHNAEVESAMEPDPRTGQSKVRFPYEVRIKLPQFGTQDIRAGGGGAVPFDPNALAAEMKRRGL